MTTFDAKAAARETVGHLMDIEAILFRPDDPFTFTSGRVSPVYVDCRKIISFPKVRGRLMDLAVALLKAQTNNEVADVIAGGETAGIPFAAWIAERLDAPMVYIRKKPKGFGRNAQIEGSFKEGDKVLLVEDLATDGGSKINFIEAVRSAGGVIDRTFVIFHYGIFPQSVTQLADMGVQLDGLATWWDALAEAEARGYLKGEQIAIVREFLEDPNGWAARRGT